MHWQWGLERRRTTRAASTVSSSCASVLAALVIQDLPISPMRALFWSAVINGIVAVPLIIMVLVLASRHAVLGSYRASRTTLVLGAAAACVMGAAAVRMLTG
jgi:Mn2+/Fe2+ NRAMP family transporter